MNVEAAIELMAKNPAVGFPWKDDLVTLVNSFLPGDSQLDPRTAEAKDIRAAIGSLDASMIQMLYASSLSSIPTPANLQPAATAGRMEDKTAERTILFGLLAVTLCICAVIMSLRVTSDDGVVAMADLLKSILEALVAKPNQ